MASAFLTYGIVCLAAAYARRQRMWLELAILLIPVIYCGYFLLSVFIFSFGENMPFTFYSRDNSEVYSYVVTSICLHFLAVFCAYSVVGRIDRKRYVSIDLSNARTLTIGPMGVAFCILPAVFVVMAVPISELWYRPRFVFESNTAHWMRFADLLLFISAVLTPFIWNSTLKFLTLFVVTIAFLAVGSRSGVVMIFIFVGIEMFVLKRNHLWVSVLLSCVALWLLGATLYLRVVHEGGVVALIDAALFIDFGTIIERIVFGLNYIFNLSFILIGEMLTTVEAEVDWFYYSIIPIPSALYDRSAEFSVSNRFRLGIPYSGFGYALGYLGLWLYISIVFSASMVFLIGRKFLSKKRDIFEAILCFSLFAFPFLVMLQYNLRTGSRMIYILTIVYFATAIGRRLKFRSGR